MGEPDACTEEDVPNEYGDYIIFQRYSWRVGVDGEEDAPYNNADNAADETIYSTGYKIRFSDSVCPKPVVYQREYNAHQVVTYNSNYDRGTVFGSLFVRCSLEGEHGAEYLYYFQSLFCDV